MLKELIENWQQYCTDKYFIGIGSTRKVFRVSEYVIKLHLHPIGYKQSSNELNIYNVMVEKGLSELFAQTFFVNEFISIQKYYKPLELINNQSFQIEANEHNDIIPNKYKEVLHRLDHEFDSFDLNDSSNYGINKKNKLVFIDYGMCKKIYEHEWIPLAEAGILPQIDYDYCTACGKKKELRMYGDKDLDKRCFSCGKE